MKKTILLFLTILLVACSSDSTTAPDPIIGKWIIYRAVYENAVYEFEINGTCGQQSLEMPPGNYPFVTETYYANDDCSGFTANTHWEWKSEGNDSYSIYVLGQTIPERTVLLTNDEIKVTEPGSITVIKYYRRVM
ncbi:hypothetical protein [Flavobacterium sp.]|uniref:hypothetical protein n=1 Tax=Flavobacterium sp. TaxID=239 RepID=UPI002487F516|nr:hypothetical protein [Flavobacterium sp.]MDI1316119.1 hypothetical protein [Flavobacterium sp.]